jgi:hypothetical protein
MKCVESLGKRDFTLDEIYCFRASSAETIMGLALPAERTSLWNMIHQKAIAVAAAEPALAAWMDEGSLIRAILQARWHN